ncbi:MAG: Glutamate--tRNA ligase [Candidatus Hodgkinia cicadicola]|nr:MAG: Glutamate--tRNA ligase [Candidatus Hodgkinia cicadicola]
MINVARVRVAPSPTGCPHLGNLLVGVCNALFKFKHKADMVLRLEDTDVSKCCVASVNKTYDAFNSIGIRFDESPKRVNKFGPYVQTQRLHIYAHFCKQLEANELAFWCKCEWRRVSALKRVNLALGDASVYDGKCLRLRLLANAKRKLRLKTPKAGVFRDCSRRSRWLGVEMQPLWVRNAPTFHLASVVDDHLMRISHVLRGRDWVASLSKHFLLYVYLKFKPPKFYHLPLLICSKGTKLSKRFWGCGVDACLSLGILPNVILIYLASLIVGGQVCEFEDAVLRFNLGFASKTHLRLNRERVLALNRRLLAQACLKPGLFESVLGQAGARKALMLCAGKSVLLTHVYKQMSFAFCFGAYQLADWIVASRCGVVLAVLLSVYKRVNAWNRLNLIGAHTLFCFRLGLSLRTLLTLIYSVVFGTRDSVSLYDSYVLLGKEVIVFRLELALVKLLA